MNLRTPGSESIETGSDKITREQVVSAYRKLVQKGFKTPFDNPNNLDDPDLLTAQKLWDQWDAQEKEGVKEDEEGQLRHNLSKTMLFIDAGFIKDAHYVASVFSNLIQDIQDIEDIPKQSNNQERVQTRNLLAQARRRVSELLQNI